MNIPKIIPMRSNNYHKVINQIVLGTQEFMGKDGVAIIGVSGGVDSAVVAYSTVKSIGADRVIAVLLPCGNQKDIADSYAVVNALGIKNYIEKDIEPAVNEIMKDVNTDHPKYKIVKGNACARVRMTELYKISNLTEHGRVIGTTNLDEWDLGYSTRGGDDTADFEPNRDIDKIEVFEIARLLNVPELIINKAPSAGLWDNQTDEGEIGITYLEMHLIRMGCPVDKIRLDIYKLKVNASYFKRQETAHIHIKF